MASWYDFAVAIGELGEQIGLLETAAKVQPICTADYPTPASLQCMSAGNDWWLVMARQQAAASVCVLVGHPT